MDYTFFGIQSVIRTFPNDGLRSRLHNLIAQAPAEQSLVDKRVFYKNFSTLLIEALPHMDFGFWDYIPRPREAEQEFDKWCSEIEGSIATESEELGDTAQEPHRSMVRKDYIIVSLVFLLQQGGNADATVAARADFPEPQCFLRMTFAHLLATVPMLSFASVRADAVYLIPGTDQDGFSYEELRGEGFEHFRPLT